MVLLLTQQLKNRNLCHRGAAITSKIDNRLGSSESNFSPEASANYNFPKSKDQMFYG
jgi:hypothetical protein